ncbi:DUF1707 domain-containing protein [Nakamurella flavida]|uniref:DUF1707 domain-containing protein n=1 Tax=Nakamurella flavida TaxID=363630 RepID=A0A939C7S8_9ACTN|nr:DUF1707 domain-containing protein [Nakamurella flavida]MBM9478472.1 DUF1707 domain-containing protein [Nakamurella flavida]MDP9777702.1 hypothetical protein [Nakamurella flavida]
MTSPGRSESDPAVVRVGDTERNSALEALGEHLTAGRLDMDEYGERSARVTTARTVADLKSVFTDLPAPHPSLPGSTVARPSGASASPWTAAAPSPPAGPDTGAVARSRAQKTVAVVTALSVPIALILFFVLGTVLSFSGAWLAFLLIPAAGAVANAVQGPTAR